MKPRWIILQRKLYGCGTLTWRWVLILSWDKHSRNSSKMRENIELKAQDGIFWQLFRTRLHSHSSAYSCNNWLNNTWFRKVCFNLHCMKRVQIRSFSGSVFFCIHTRKNSVFGHFWSSAESQKIIPHYAVRQQKGARKQISATFQTVEFLLTSYRILSLDFKISRLSSSLILLCLLNWPST